MKITREIIPTHKLTLNMIPSPEEDINIIFKFATTFDLGEIDGKYELKSNPNFDTENFSLEELRAYLYTEQRTWNHFMRDPSEKAKNKISKIISLMRTILKD